MEPKITFVTRLKRHWKAITVAASFVALVTLSIYLGVNLLNANKDLKGQKALVGELRATTFKLNEDIAQSQKANESLALGLETAKIKSEILLEAGLFLEGKFDELDAILLTTDSNSLNLINWMAENGQFYENYSGESRTRYVQWGVVQQQTNDDYVALKQEIEWYIAELDGTEDTQIQVQ